MRQGERGGIEHGCRDKELRQWGGGVAAGVGAGGRVLGLGETGGCSTARYGVTTSKIPSSPDFVRPNASHTQQQESLQSRESYSTATLKFQTFFDWYLCTGSKASDGAK